RGSVKPVAEYSFGRQNWFDCHAAEHCAAREAAAIFDQTGFSKFVFKGRDVVSVLQRLCGNNVDVPIGHAVYTGMFNERGGIGIGQSTVRAVRITYVGELGWELHVPMDQAVSVYDTLMKAGADLGVTNAGHYAINSLRLEKGYRAWGAELSPDDTRLEAGLGFAIDWSKPFLGREALEKQKRGGAKRRLVIFVLEDPEPVLWGSEPIHRNGTPVGYTTS